MPDEKCWASFFDPPLILAQLGLTAACHDVAEFGCGYGTFTVPAARIISGTVHAFDIDPEMIEATRSRLMAAGLSNIHLCLRDFVAEGTGLSDESTEYAMLFNILHAEEPAVLLQEAHRILAPKGKVGIIHWNCDPSTPRGPSMEIRPRPEQCEAWAQQVGFHTLPPGIIALPPHHYGMVLEKGHRASFMGRTHSAEERARSDYESE